MLDIQSALKQKLFKQKILLHMGCRDCGSEDTYMGVNVLARLGISAESREFECGCDLYGSDGSRLASHVAENMKSLKGFSQAIVGCARCYHVMKAYYPLEVVHISDVILKRISAMERSFGGSGDVYYHDPCYLARFEKLMDGPREALRILGYTVREFPASREKADCCGDYSPSRAIRERGAEMRLSQLAQVRDPAAKCIVTAACPKCTNNFSSFNKENSKITVKHYLELVDEALSSVNPAYYL